jgi:cytochrome d ubiquinol oxidase subunit I
MRTADGSSLNVSAANGLFTLLGFMGMYAMLSIFLLFLLQRILARGPEPRRASPAPAPVTLPISR